MTHIKTFSLKNKYRCPLLMTAVLVNWLHIINITLIALMHEASLDIKRQEEDTLGVMKVWVGQER